MSGRAKQRPPRDALRFPMVEDVRWDRADVERAADLHYELSHLHEWLDANGFPFWIPVLEENDLRISRDGRTLYGLRFLVRCGRPIPQAKCPSWDYTVTPDGSDMVTRTFSYPIVRPLRDYAPTLASFMRVR